jgi:SdrD B-like protein
MSQEVRQTELKEQTQQLLHGPLKHARAAALAAALLPLASVAATPASAQQTPCASAGMVCGTVWQDANNNGIQDDGNTGIPGVTVTLGSTTFMTDADGYFEFIVPPGTYQIVVNIPSGTQPSPSNLGGNDTTDSDGTPGAIGTVVATVTLSPSEAFDADTDFGFVPSDVISDGDVPNPCDFVTSGGFVIGDSGKKITFGIHGGCKHGEFWGHLNVVDHATGYHINSTDITAYLVPTGAPPFTREICGLATTNNPSDPSSVMFRVRLIDNGEPGSSDKLGIRLSTGYHVSTRLLSALKPGGGNIQLHDPNPSTDETPATLNCWGVASPDMQ